MRQSADWRILPSTRAAALVLAIAFGIILIAMVWLGLSWIRDDQSPSVSAKEVQLSDPDNGAVVNLTRGGKLIIALASNPSTGFSWYLGERAEPGLELVDGPRYVPPGSTQPVLGAPGTEVFTFNATEVGTAQIVLEYRRSFEPDLPPSKTFRVTAEVR
jgi:inhibitor of cysteine peptidase